jgi:hypothetical protein
MSKGERGRARAIFDADFGENRRQMTGNRLLAEKERFRNLTVGLTLCHQSQHFHFAIA